jgi:hypothetical protein
VQLDPGAPRFHTALTAEYDDPCRFSRSLVIRTGIHRRGRWAGIRLSWLSVQAKIPIGTREDSVWGIVIGWWRYPRVNEEWSALLKAVRLGRTDGDEAVNYENPTSASARRALRRVYGRRMDAAVDLRVDE